MGSSIRTYGDLLAREPRRYGLRGDDVLWRTLAEQHAQVPLHDSLWEVESFLNASIEEIVGARFGDIPASAHLFDVQGSAYVPRFDPGHGMSAGWVSLVWWRDTGLPILLDRAGAVRSEFSG